MRPGDAEGGGGLGHAQDEPVVTMHVVTSQNEASDEAVANDWRSRGPDATQIGRVGGRTWAACARGLNANLNAPLNARLNGAKKSAEGSVIASGLEIGRAH